MHNFYQHVVQIEIQKSKLKKVDTFGILIFKFWNLF
jgi:hypothetical protein